MTNKHLFRRLLEKAIVMALWTKVILCVKSSLLEQRLPRTPSRLTTNQRQSAKSAFKIRVIPWLIKDLRENKALYNCRETFTDVMSALQINLFMQNKANFQKVKLNVNKVLTKNYVQMDTWSIRKTKPIQSQLKPIKANKMPKQTQFKPKQTQFLPATPFGRACPPSVWRVTGKKSSWGAGLGKYLKGLRVVRTNDRPPGIARALIRILIPIGLIESVRNPLNMALISDADWTWIQTVIYVATANICAWIPVLFTLRARRENGFATLWDLFTGTRVVIKPRGTVRPSIEPVAKPEISAEATDSLGPYRIIKELVPGKWIIATDLVLRRRVWLLLRNSPELSLARRNLARHGRLRWLQKVKTPEATWDAFEATEGVPFSSLLEGNKRLPWSNLRHWLHDLASELWAATGDNTLPVELSLVHVWITAQGHAVLLDETWPDVKTRAESIPVGDLAGQQRFLKTIAACAESTGFPLHAKGVLQNLEDAKFEKLSFLAGTLRGLLDKPAEVSRGIRAGSIFMMPLYLWIVVFVGYYHDKQWNDSLGGIVMITIMVILGAIALFQLLGLAFHSTIGHSIFRLAVVNAKGRLANRVTLLRRWAIVWLPLFIPMSFVALLVKRGEPNAAFILSVVLLLLWISAAVYAVIHPKRSLHDRLAGTWIVRR